MTRVAGEEEEVVDTETDIGDLEEEAAAAANTRTRNTRVRTKNTRATRATGTRTGKERGKTLVPTDTTASRQRKNDTKSWCRNQKLQQLLIFQMDLLIPG